MVTDSNGAQLSDLPGFGRFHGILIDPQQKYAALSMFAPNGGYVGIMDTSTKEAVALFRATGFNVGRSAHMSFWSQDGSALIIDNLNGKAIERINVKRDSEGTITQLYFDKSATVGLGKGMAVTDEATFFRGSNAFGKPLIGAVSGAYPDADLGDLTPNGFCKENGCGGSNEYDGHLGGRPNNLPICPLPSTNDRIYTTLAGGGLLVIDAKSTPMSIKGEYGNKIIYGAGCGGTQVGNKMFIKFWSVRLCCWGYAKCKLFMPFSLLWHNQSFLIEALIHSSLSLSGLSRARHADVFGLGL